MKKEKRFIITEIYQNDMHAVDKVLVDTQTHIEYLLHQEGSGCSCTVLVDENGKPLQCLNAVEHPDAVARPSSAYIQKDLIQKRPKDEPLEKLKEVKIKRKRRKANEQPD